MSRNLSFSVLILVIARCLTQEQFPRPTFPEVFQTEVEAIFENGNGVSELDIDMFFDRTNNRVAFFIEGNGEFRKTIFNFNTQEIIIIDSNDCDVREIPDKPTGFLRYKMDYFDGGKKTLLPAEQSFYFSENAQDRHVLYQDIIPAVVYTTRRDVEYDGEQLSNCILTHVFSKPDLERPTCKDGIYCNSTLLVFAVECKNPALNYVYRFSRFVYEILDESVFLPTPGIHCDMKSSKPIPEFPSYFSFTFDAIENMVESQKNSPVFNTHKEVWYDSEYNITRIDEFDHSGLLLSSRIYDFKAGVAFTIVATSPTCMMGEIPGPITLEQITQLPRSFFAESNSEIEKAVYVGKRKVDGLYYDVWSRTWINKASNAMVVEEIHFLQIIPNNEMTSKNAEPYFQISHVDMYTYEMSFDSEMYELKLFKYFSINNYRSSPRELTAFDVFTCFDKAHRKEFSMKVKGLDVVKGSLPYREILEGLYKNILAVTKVSVVRISELTGVFDGLQLTEIRASILDNSESIGWPKNSGEPGMEKTFELIKEAAKQDKLSVDFVSENNKKNKLIVMSVEEIRISSEPKSSSCYSGASLASASLALLLLGIFFGVVGYYIFLKKRRSRNNHVQMSEFDN